MGVLSTPYCKYSVLLYNKVTVLVYLYCTRTSTESVAKVTGYSYSVVSIPVWVWRYTTEYWPVRVLSVPWPLLEYRKFCTVCILYVQVQYKSAIRTWQYFLSIQLLLANYNGIYLTVFGE